MNKLAVADTDSRFSFSSILVVASGVRYLQISSSIPILGTKYGPTIVFFRLEGGGESQKYSVKIPIEEYFIF